MDVTVVTNAVKHVTLRKEENMLPVPRSSAREKLRVDDWSRK